MTTDPLMAGATCLEFETARNHFFNRMRPSSPYTFEQIVDDDERNPATADGTRYLGCSRAIDSLDFTVGLNLHRNPSATHFKCLIRVFKCVNDERTETRVIIQLGVLFLGVNNGDLIRVNTHRMYDPNNQGSFKPFASCQFKLFCVSNMDESEQFKQAIDYFQDNGVPLPSCARYVAFQHIDSGKWLGENDGELSLCDHLEIFELDCPPLEEDDLLV